MNNIFSIITIQIQQSNQLINWDIAEVYKNEKTSKIQTHKASIKGGRGYEA